MLRLESSSTTLMRYVPGGRVKLPTSTGSVRVNVEFSLSLCAFATGADATPRRVANVPRARQVISFFISEPLLSLALLLLMMGFRETGDGPATGLARAEREPRSLAEAPRPRRNECVRGRSSDDSSSLDELDQHDHDGDDEQDVDEAAHRGGGDHSQNPEDQKDQADCPEHRISFLPSNPGGLGPGRWRRPPAAPEAES